jgi:NAD(P)-dependent dehydrogenase (short-subunit alcohol dehydrogenase family)
MHKSKVVLITGAVRNTGLAIAEAFAEAGVTVVLNGRKPEDVAREAVRLRQTYGGRVVEAPADVSRQDEVDGLFAAIRRECGRLDVLVNNAIIQGVGHSLVDTPRELLEEVFRVNVFGAYACAQGAARMMIERGCGCIVNIGSNTAERAIRMRTAYCASKAAIDGLTRAMAVELGPHGIRVNGVVAGYIHTPRWDGLSQAETDRRHANIPLGCEASGADIAKAVLFLASDSAAKITGARLVVDGGTLAQLVPSDCNV